MKLIELTVRNFMPYYGSMTISFPDDPNRNVMIVSGDNMRGKTSLLNAIRWAFYGKALGRHSREIPLQAIVNKDATLEGDWSVESRVVFEADGHKYEFRRLATKKALVANPTRPEDFDVVRALQRDGLVMSDHLIDAELNRYAPEQTSRFFLFDGELLQEYEALLIDGHEQGRKIKETIEQALGVPTLIRGREDAQTILKMSQRIQTKEIERMAGLEKQAERQAELQARVASHEKDVQTLREQLASIRSERADLDDFIEATEAIHKAKTQLVEKEAAYKASADRSKDLSAERLGLFRDAWKELLRPQLELKREHVLQEVSQVESEISRRSRMQARIDQLRNSISNAVCEACGQPFHAEQREKAGTELGELEAEIRSVVVNLESAQAHTSSLRELDKLLSTGPLKRLEAIDRDLAKISVEQTKLENDIEKLHDLIKGEDTAEIARRRALRDGLVRQEGGLDTSIKNAEASLDKTNKELAMLSRALENNPQARSSRGSVMVRISDALGRAFGHSVDKLRDDLKTRVEQLASDAFKRLTTQTKYSGLRINNNYGLSILDELGHEVSVRSAGAEQIVALSLIDGLARAGRSSGPVVMDTPFGRLDPKHRANILRYLPANNEQIILLVHEGEFNKTVDLPPIASRIGRYYEINEVSPRQSRIERVTQ